ncbi:hypothetical protein EYC84_000898 [Monilinia fructicola]|uniref:Uncharacterized protein n=1 Tax=Monilinia fructicola TaxID=38448 RepID=A0A5M9JIX1_MONFR|nr:hypothetical protein EYC84_000898 [Monilinia fructicola]
MHLSISSYLDFFFTNYRPNGANRYRLSKLWIHSYQNAVQKNLHLIINIPRKYDLIQRAIFYSSIHPSTHPPIHHASHITSFGSHRFPGPFLFLHHSRICHENHCRKASCRQILSSFLSLQRHASQNVMPL